MKLLVLLSAVGIALGADDKEDVASAARKAAAADSYTFRVETKLDGTAGNLVGREIPAIEGKYQKDAGFLLSLGERGQLFRKGERTLVKTPDGTWQDAQNFRPGGGQGGQPRQALAGRMLRGFRAPHEELQVFEKGLKDLTKAEAKEKADGKDCAVYSADLTPEAVKESPLGRMIGQLGQLGGGQGIEMKGKAKAWVDGEGNLVRYELSNTISGEIQGNAFDFGMTRTIVLTAVGKTQLEIPDEVKKLLESKPEEKKEEPKKEEPKKGEPKKDF